MKKKEHQSALEYGDSMVRYIPYDSYTDIVIDFSRKDIKIVRRMLDEDVATCVADLRREFKGRAATSPDWGGARYYEPLSDEYYTVVAQIQDIYKAIETCKKKSHN